jgi:polysaccharide pyruvyl transferase WcaK-like protein
MKRIVLSGYSGFDNAGDEAVLSGLTKAQRSQCVSAEIAIEALSSNPASTVRDHRIFAAHRMRAGAVLRSVSRADLVASGGGSLLQDTTSRHGIF